MERKRDGWSGCSLANGRLFARAMFCGGILYSTGLVVSRAQNDC